MNYFIKIFFSVTLAIFFFAAPSVFATENPFTFTIAKSATSVTVTVVSSKANITGWISLSKGSDPAFKNCNVVFNSEGRALPCSASGLVQKEIYYVVAQASDLNGNTYKGVEHFQLGVATPPVTPKPNPTQTPPIVSTPPKPTVQNPTPATPDSKATAVTETSAELDSAAIAADKEGNGIVPCHNTCEFNDVLILINNIITFLVTKLFIPIVILMFMYAGYQYIAAQGVPAKKANVKSMLIHIVIGMLFVLCSWLIVKTVLSILLRDPSGTLLQ